MDKWITNEGIEYNIPEMSTKHIVNIMRCWDGKGKLTIPEDYLGGKDKWFGIFREELDKRKSSTTTKRNGRE